jgi:PAP2 superfamily protein
VALALCYSGSLRAAEGTGKIETEKNRRYLLSGWALTVLLGGVDWILADRAGLAFVGWIRVACVLIFLFVVGVVYGYSGRNRRLGDAGNYAALWVAFSAAGAISTYLAATFAMPLRDAEFIAIDASMGFHWLEWYRFIQSHRAIELPLFVAYFTFLPQIIASILYFAHTGQTSRNAEMIWIAMPALILTSIVSAVLPAIGPYVHYFGRETADIVVLMSVRAGGAHTFVVNRLEGIITFPSFHTILAIVFTYVHRPPSRSFVPVAILNGLMLLAIPSEGHHYLVDVISGAAIAGLCIAVVRAAMRPRLETDSPTISREQMPRVAG